MYPLYGSEGPKAGRQFRMDRAAPVHGCIRIPRGPILSQMKRSLAGGVKWVTARSSRGAKVGFLLADGASVGGAGAYRR